MHLCSAYYGLLYALEGWTSSWGGTYMVFVPTSCINCRSGGSYRRVFSETFASKTQALLGPQETYLCKDFYKEIILGNPKHVGSLGLR